MVIRSRSRRRNRKGYVEVLNSKSEDVLGGVWIVGEDGSGVFIRAPSLPRQGLHTRNVDEVREAEQASPGFRSGKATPLTRGTENSSNRRGHNCTKPLQEGI